MSISNSLTTKTAKKYKVKTLSCYGLWSMEKLCDPAYPAGMLYAPQL